MTFNMSMLHGFSYVSGIPDVKMKIWDRSILKQKF